MSMSSQPSLPGPKRARAFAHLRAGKLPNNRTADEVLGGDNDGGASGHNWSIDDLRSNSLA